MTASLAARRRGLALPALAAVVLGLHLVALAWFAPGATGDRARIVSVAPIRVRHVVVPPPAITPSPAAAPTAAARARRVGTRAAPAVPPPAGPAPPPAVPDGTEVPVYATQVPPPGRWHYRLQRGAASGEAELEWSRPDGRYELRLQGRVAGATVLEWASQGAIDAAGVAPERLAVRRRGRDSQATNFQRDAGKITFSGPTHEVPLLPGAQDRLSWMVQLPAIVDAAPERFGAGTRIVLFVAGTRGDADRWAFDVQGVEMQGDTPALKLVREPLRLYDTRVEVWLDAADHHMPVRAVQTPAGGGTALELQRERKSP